MAEVALGPGKRGYRTSEFCLGSPYDPGCVR